MITKIISGGQTGADRAALDAAIEYGVPHGGWIPKGRRTEDGRLPDRYILQETGTIGYPQRTQLNILDSDGTLILSHGKLIGGSALTQNLARKHSRSCLHIDLDEITQYKAVEIIKSWIDIKKIEILNVAGSRGSKDPLIYDAVKDVIKSVLYIPPEQITENYPKTVDEAVEHLFSELPFKDKTKIAKMDKQDLSVLPFTIGRYIREQFGLGRENEKLMQSCRSLAGEDDLHEETASMVIIEVLWERLRETHGLRAVK
jgi:hypothetical protein